MKIEPVGRQIKRILIFYGTGNHSLLFGIHLFDKDGNEILKTAYDCSGKPSNERILADSERIVGIKSRKHSDAEPAAHYDF